MDQYFDIYLIKGFAKKPNSTKRPEIDINKEVTTKQKRVRGRLRDGCSIFQPVVEIRWDVKPLKTQGGTDYPDPPYQQADIIAYNYAYIQLFGDYNTATYGDYFDNVHGRYYYITDITINNSGLYQLSLDIDPLATYRDDIGGSSQYIVRSSLGNYNIADGTLPTNLQRSVVSAKGGKLFGSGTCNVVLIAGTDSVTGLSAVVAGGSSLLMRADFWQDADGNEPTDAEWEAMNVPALIKGAYTLPIATKDLSTVNVTVSAGKFSTKQPLISISPDSSVEKSTSVTLPKHPQADSYPFLQSNTYSDYRLFVPFLGVIPVSPGLASGSLINITARCDPLSGTANIRCVFGDDASLIQAATVSIAGYSGFGGVIGNSATASAVGAATERGAMISGGASVAAAGAGLAAASLATGGAALAVAAVAACITVAASAANTANALAINGINTSIASAQNSVSTVSGGGNRFEGGRTVMITGSFITIASGATVTGKPDCTIRKISESVTDSDRFIVVSCPHIDIPGANISEIQAIYQAMTGGFYYE